MVGYPPIWSALGRVILRGGHRAYLVLLGAGGDPGGPGRGRGPFAGVRRWWRPFPGRVGPRWQCSWPSRVHRDTGAADARQRAM